MTEAQPQENNVWGTGSPRAWYKEEHHEAKRARGSGEPFLPRKARARVVPSNPGYSGYLWVLTVLLIGYLWVLMGTHSTLIVYSPGTKAYSPGTPRVLSGYPRVLSGYKFLLWDQMTRHDPAPPGYQFGPRLKMICFCPPQSHPGREKKWALKTVTRK